MVSEFGQYHTKCFAVLAWSLAFIQTYSSAGIWAIRRLCADNTETRSWKLKTIILNFAYQNRFSMLNRSHHCIISFILHERLERNFECVCKWNYSEIHHLLHSFYISEFNQNLNKKISITLKSSVIQKPRWFQIESSVVFTIRIIVGPFFLIDFVKVRRHVSIREDLMNGYHLWLHRFIFFVIVVGFVVLRSLLLSS